ncbi:MAG TPA: signal peptidase I [Saprospiraceae bacterium]|nr:signal peptidase I [Saprospiraceae bacterium]
MKFEKKLYWGIAILGLLFFGVYYTLLGLGFLQFYRPQSDNMMPNIKPKTLVATWKQSHFQRHDLVALYDTCLAIPGHREAVRENYLGRIVALEGEELQIKGGQVYINGSLSEQPYQTRKHYLMSKTNYEALESKLPRPADIASMSEVWLALDDHEAEELKKMAPDLRLRDFPLADMVTIWKKDWSIHEFGPVTIPPGHVFILGDFRSNAEDSRFRGFVPLEDVHAKVIFP